jgi:hypothetical protein
LNHAPLLIEALKDSDPGVSDAAREGLRFLARRFSAPVAGGGMTDIERLAERTQWKAWYQRVRPSAVLED